MMLANQNANDKHRQIIKYRQYYQGWQTSMNPSGGGEDTEFWILTDEKDQFRQERKEKEAWKLCMLYMYGHIITTAMQSDSKTYV